MNHHAPMPDDSHLAHPGSPNPLARGHLPSGVDSGGDDPGPPDASGDGGLAHGHTPTTLHATWPCIEMRD